MPVDSDRKVSGAPSRNKMSSPQAASFVAESSASGSSTQPPPQQMTGPSRPLNSSQVEWAFHPQTEVQTEVLRQLSLMGNYPVHPQVTPPWSVPRSLGRSQGLQMHPANRDDRHMRLRIAIMQFYEKHSPEKLTEDDFIDFICSVYGGREAELDEALRWKYGVGLRLPQTSAWLMPSSPQAFAGLGRMTGELSSPGSFDPACVNSDQAWLHAGSAQQQCSSMQHGGGSQMEEPSRMVNQRLQQLQPDDAAAGIYDFGCDEGSLPSWTCALEGTQRDDSEGPELSWIDQIVMEDGGLEVPDEVARAILSKNATKYRDLRLLIK
ncbi:unnamed protein product [Effrenium voratum]|nr:unnamed protein product [Effrenium voratum]